MNQMTQSKKPVDVFAILGLVTLLSILFVPTILYYMPKKEAKADITPIHISSVLDNDILTRFESQVETALEISHNKQMAALKEQHNLLEKIQISLQELAAKEEQIRQIEERKLIIEPAPIHIVEPIRIIENVKPIIQESIKSAPVKMPGSTWNVNGDWNYSTNKIASHLSSVHGVNPSGFSHQEMVAMHDNLHNGYSAMGNNSKVVKSKTQYTMPRRTRIFRSSDCPTGTCPQ